MKQRVEKQQRRSMKVKADSSKISTNKSLARLTRKTEAETQNSYHQNHIRNKRQDIITHLREIKYTTKSFIKLYINELAQLK